MQYRYSTATHEHFKAEEGYRNDSYLDHQDNWTIGIGHLLGKSNAFRGIRWSDEKVLQVFENDLDIVVGNARQLFPEYDILPPNVRLAILDMLFNMGINRFRGFKKTIRLIHEGRFQEAALEALDSEWAKHDVPNRAKRIAKLLSNT